MFAFEKHALLLGLPVVGWNEGDESCCGTFIYSSSMRSVQLIADDKVVLLFKWYNDITKDEVAITWRVGRAGYNHIIKLDKFLLIDDKGIIAIRDEVVAARDLHDELAKRLKVIPSNLKSMIKVWSK